MGLSLLRPRWLRVAALARAAVQAERSGAALHLLHADAPFESPGDGAPDASPSVVLGVRGELSAADALSLDGQALDALAAVIPVVREPAPPAAILRDVSRANADLLVVGRRGRSRLAHVPLGSVAEALVTAAPCPVLMLRQSDWPGADAAPLRSAFAF